VQSSISSPRRLIGPLTAIGVVMCIAGIAASTGAIHARLYGHDIFFLLDNGWRVLHGQRVHVDFSSGWGPVTFLLVAAGLAVSGGSVAAVSYANAIVALAAGLWCVWLAAGRSRTMMTVLCPCFVALLAAAPFALGDVLTSTSHGMVYNRYGYALLTLLMLECFQPAAEDLQTTNRRWIEPALTGCALGILLFLKITYFLVALPLLGMSLLFRKPLGRRALAHAIGFLATALVFLAYLRFDVGAMSRDLLAAGAARSGSLGLRHGLAELLAGGIPRAVLLAAVTFRCWRGWRYPLIAVLVVVVDSLLLLTNAQMLCYPVTAAYSVVLLFSIKPGLRSSRLPVLAAGLLAVPMVLMEIGGLGYGLVESRANPDPPGVLRFESAQLRPLVLYDVASDDIDNKYANGSEYVSSINDGIRLLTAHTSRVDKVTTLDMFNPFAFALGREPIRGGIAAAAYRYTLDDLHHPSPASFFGDASVVMVPKYPASPHLFYDGYRNIYEPALRKEFRLEAESSRWWLYRRATGPDVSPAASVVTARKGH
jgi:hypothetical protein